MSYPLKGGKGVSPHTAAIANDVNHTIGWYAGWSYSYLNDEHLTWVQDYYATKTYALYYDALGRCVRRTLNGVNTYYIYDGEKPIREYTSTGGNVGWNIYGKGIDEIVRRWEVGSNQWYLVQQNHEGNVTHLFNYIGPSATVIEKYSYDAFGKPTIYNASGGVITTSAYGNRFLFTGREYAATFGFYEYRARAYHPGLGRFMSEDPKLFEAGDYNLFRYCHNDPLDLTDPMGLEEESHYPRTKERQSDLDRQRDRSHRYIAGADGKWHLRDDSGAQSLNLRSKGEGEAGRQVIAGDPNAPMPKIVIKAPPTALTPGHAKGLGLADITNVRLLASGGPSAQQAASMRQFANATDTVVGTYAVAGVGGMALAEAGAGAALAPVRNLAQHSYYGARYYITYASNGLRTSGFRAAAQYVMEDAEFSVVRATPPLPPPVATAPVVPPGF